MTDLDRYRALRDFSATPEPAPGSGPASAGDRFVVQRHDAGSLHFDLRLEHEGVLLSWALPKGVPLRPDQRRLAIATEPHPVEYLDFAGMIPEGNYGAGRMTIWDRGGYSVLARGPDEWKVVLAGGVLTGEYHLVRSARDRPDQWLMFRSASAGPGIPDPGPRFEQLRPMLATAVDDAFDDPGWTFEIKWDGFRALALVGPDGTRLRSRTGKDLGERFPLGDLRRGVFVQEAILDGELVVLDERGRADFGALQRGAGEVCLIVFDVLYADGVWLLDEALAVRRELLGRMITPEAAPRMRISDDMPGRGRDLFRAVEGHGVEGIVAKRLDAPYRSDTRSDAWRKIAARRRGDFVIVGIARGGADARDAITSLVVAESIDGHLVARGRVGAGITTEHAGQLAARLEPLTPGSPAPVEFTDPEVVPVRPVLRCRVSYLELTEEGRLRAPVFGGLAADGSVPEADPTPAEGRVIADGDRRVTLTNTTKLYWPADGLRKGDLIDHYLRVADVLVPHLRGRAMVLKRYPEGIETAPFFQHTVPDGAPDWLHTAELTRGDDTKRAVNRYAVVDDPLALLWVVNLGCIDLNPWQSTLIRPNEPDWVLFDLDPMPGVPFSRVVETALLIRDRLDDLALRAYPKTSGGDGMHLFVPAAPGCDYSVARLFAAALAAQLERARPDLVTSSFAKAERGSRVYIDTNQIGRGRSIAAVYSVRPRGGAPVSTPLGWEEVGAELDPGRFTMAEVARRVAAHGDLFAPVLEGGQDIAAAARRLTDAGGDGSAFGGEGSGDRRRN